MRSRRCKFDTPIGEIDIRGLKYKIYLYPKKIFKHRYPDTLAQVEDFPYLARFCEENLELGVIRHEVFHMYVASCFFSTMVTEAAEDMEELAADLFGTLADQMLEKSQDLHELLKKELERRNNEKNHKQRH